MYIVLGVTGSISAYKAADIANQLHKDGHEVHVVMTEGGTQFITPLTMQTLSKNKVHVGEFEEYDPTIVKHIDLAGHADVVLIAPATANIIGKIANGIADDAVSTFGATFEGPVLVAPAMNPKMWRHPANLENVEILKSRDVSIIGPAEGRVACGDETEKGRMVEPDEIYAAIAAVLPLEN